MRRLDDSGPLLTSLSDRLDDLPRGVLLGASLAGVLVLGAVDYATGPLVAFSIFYLIPVAAIAWKYPRRLVVLVSVLAATTWLAADVASGQVFPHWWIPVWNTATRFGVFVLVATLIGMLHSTLREQAILASVDPLTGVENGRSFRSHAARCVDEMRTRKMPLTFAYIDVDDFKMVNDSLGHSGGDELLRSIGRALVEVTRASDRVGRVGGDEFALLLPDTGSEGARRVMSNLHDRVSAAIDVRPGLRVSLSAGAVTFLVPPDGVDDMVTVADSLMYESKRAGKATYRHVTVGEGSPGAFDDRSAPRSRDGPPRVIDLTRESTASLVSR